MCFLSCFTSSSEKKKADNGLKNKSEENPAAEEDENGAEKLPAKSEHHAFDE